MLGSALRLGESRLCRQVMRYDFERHQHSDAVIYLDVTARQQPVRQVSRLPFGDARGRQKGGWGVKRASSAGHSRSLAVTGGHPKTALYLGG